MSVNNRHHNGDRRRGAPQIDEQELASRTIQIQNKRFYLDVKQNSRGRFIKITEVGLGGQKSRILMSIPAAHEVQEKLKNLDEAYGKLEPHDPKSLASDGLLESETLVRDNRRYYMDLRENERGRFIRMSMLSMGVRMHIALPADGLKDLLSGLEELISEHCDAADLTTPSDLPDAKVLFAGNKTFYFDVGSNRYGVFLRISELRANFRTAVTIPEHHWGKFRDIITDLADKVGTKNGDAGSGDEEGERAATSSEGDKPPPLKKEHQGEAKSNGNGPAAIPVA